MTAIVSKKKGFQSIFIVLLTNDLLFETQNPHYFLFSYYCSNKKKEHLAFRQTCKIFYQKSGQKTTLINFQSRKNR